MASYQEICPLCASPIRKEDVSCRNCSVQIQRKNTEQSVWLRQDHAGFSKKEIDQQQAESVIESVSQAEARLEITGPVDFGDRVIDPSIANLLGGKSLELLTEDQKRYSDTTHKTNFLLVQENRYLSNTAGGTESMESASLSLGKRSRIMTLSQMWWFPVVMLAVPYVGVFIGMFFWIRLEKQEKIKAAVLVIISCVLALGKGIIQSQ